MATEQEDEGAPTPEGPDEVAVLAALLRGGRVEDRRAAARQLGRGAPEAEAAIPALIAAFDDADLPVRAAAVAALARWGAAAVPALMEVLRQGHPDVQKVAVVALGAMTHRPRANCSSRRWRTAGWAPARPRH
jgi:HEAT repeat protein